MACLQRAVAKSSMMMKRCAGAVAMLLFSACATTPAPPAVPPPAGNFFTDAFTLDAIAVLVPAQAGSPKRRFHLHWKRGADGEQLDNEILIKGPLGAAHARLVYTTDLRGAAAGVATLWWEGRVYRGESVGVLAEKLLGFVTPIDSLPYWLRGTPDPRYSVRETVHSVHHIVRIVQQQWRVDIQQRDAATALPSELLLHAPRKQGQLKMSITQWQ